jgi:hypothetical protein
MCVAITEPFISRDARSHDNDRRIRFIKAHVFRYSLFVHNSSRSRHAQAWMSILFNVSGILAWSYHIYNIMLLIICTHTLYVFIETYPMVDLRFILLFHALRTKEITFWNIVQSNAIGMENYTYAYIEFISICTTLLL